MKRFYKIMTAGILCMSLLTGCIQKVSQNVSVIKKQEIEHIESTDSTDVSEEKEEQANDPLEAAKKLVEEGELTLYLKDYSVDECKEFVNELYYRNPQFFWLTGAFQYKEINGDITLELDSMYDDIEERKAQLEVAVAPVLEQASGMESDYDKAIYVHDWLCDTITYNHSEDAADQNIYSALVEHSCVCSGYARSYAYLMKRLGIETFILAGEAQNEAHAWNGIYLDGELYFVDVTWDDVDGEDAVHCYGLFGMNTEQMNQIYTVDYPKVVPETTAEACNYYKRNGWYLRNCDENELISILESQNENNPLRIQCANEEVYNWLLTLLGEQRVYDYFNFAGIWTNGLSYIYRESANEFVIEWN